MTTLNVLPAKTLAGNGSIACCRVSTSFILCWWLSCECADVWLLCLFRRVSSSVVTACNRACRCSRHCHVSDAQIPRKHACARTHPHCAVRHAHTQEGWRKLYLTRFLCALLVAALDAKLSTACHADTEDGCSSRTWYNSCESCWS